MYDKRRATDNAWEGGEAITATLEAAEECGYNLLDLVRAHKSINASTAALIRTEGARIMRDGAE